MKVFLKILTLFIGISAIAGSVMMWVDPAGMCCDMQPLLEMLRTKMPWPDIFFQNFIPSGFVLLILIGLPHFTSAFLLFKNHCLAHFAIFACGVILMCWTALEWWVWDFNAMSNLYFFLGLFEAIAAKFSK